MSSIYGWKITLLGNPDLISYVAFSQSVLPDSLLPPSTLEIERVINLSIKQGMAQFYATQQNRNPGALPPPPPNVNSLPSGGYDALLNMIVNFAINTYGFRTSSFTEFSNGTTIQFLTPVVLAW